MPGSTPSPVRRSPPRSRPRAEAPGRAPRGRAPQRPKTSAGLSASSPDRAARRTALPPGRSAPWPHSATAPTDASSSHCRSSSTIANGVRRARCRSNERTASKSRARSVGAERRSAEVGPEQCQMLPCVLRNVSPGTALKRRSRRHRDARLPLRRRGPLRQRPPIIAMRSARCSSRRLLPMPGSPVTRRRESFGRWRPSRPIRRSVRAPAKRPTNGMTEPGRADRRLPPDRRRRVEPCSRFERSPPDLAPGALQRTGQRRARLRARAGAGRPHIAPELRAGDPVGRAADDAAWPSSDSGSAATRDAHERAPPRDGARADRRAPRSAPRRSVLNAARSARHHCWKR